MDALYPWLEPLVDQWRTLYIERRLHHALLLLSPQGMGRKCALTALAQLLLCQDAHNGYACGKCHSCQLLDAGTHPDLYILGSEDGHKQISIDAVRKANEFAWKTSSIGSRRVILIESAELLGEAAANALLKTLEEPPENCQFLLYSNAIDRLLPTITSRCGKWQIEKPDEDLLLNWVEQELVKYRLPSKKVTRDILRVNANSPIETLDFIREEKIKELDAIINAFCIFVQTDHYDFQDLVNLCEKSFPHSLHWLSYLLLDIAKHQQGATQHLIYSERQDKLMSLKQSIRSDTVFKQYQALNRLTRSLIQQSGLNKTLLITNWLLDF